ncbi:unnamed protein product, partial [Ectocarpus sp. 12 AP-2014]
PPPPPLLLLLLLLKSKPSRKPSDEVSQLFSSTSSASFISRPRYHSSMLSPWPEPIDMSPTLPQLLQASTSPRALSPVGGLRCGSTSKSTANSAAPTSPPTEEPLLF